MLEGGEGWDHPSHRCSQPQEYLSSDYINPPPADLGFLFLKAFPIFVLFILLGTLVRVFLSPLCRQEK